ncbi:hypothetical protein [Aurantimicrobium minutum]|uniref:hypothetical protein n=1 Tax=Aurantimicrobium minutum TaxID=708131 RepID=UPI002476F53F|nr:hypothetical protein [Aurantimicrobium minutum]
MLAPFTELICIGASSLGSSVGTGVGSGVGVGENTGDDESGVLEGDSSGVGVGADVEVGSIEGVAVGVGGASIAWALRGMLESGISIAIKSVSSEKERPLLATLEKKLIIGFPP